MIALLWLAAVVVTIYGTIVLDRLLAWVVDWVFMWCLAFSTMTAWSLAYWLGWSAGGVWSFLIPVTTFFVLVHRRWTDGQEIIRRARRAAQIEEVASGALSAVDDGPDARYFGMVQVQAGAQVVLNHHFDQELAQNGVRAKSRIVRLCTLMVKGGLGASEERRSPAQTAVAEDWLRRQLSELTMGAIRKADMAWIVPMSVELAYSPCSLDEDLALVRRSLAVSEWRRRAHGDAMLRLAEWIARAYAQA